MTPLKEVEQAMAGRQSHIRKVGRVPGRQHQAPRFRRRPDGRDKIGKLVDLGAVRRLPAPPLLAVDRSKIAILVGPLIPDRDAVFLKIADVGVAADWNHEVLEEVAAEGDVPAYRYERFTRKVPVTV